MRSFADALTGEDLGPVVEAFRLSRARQARLHPCNRAQVLGHTQERVCSVLIQGQWTRQELPLEVTEAAQSECDEISVFVLNFLQDRLPVQTDGLGIVQWGVQVG